MLPNRSWAVGLVACATAACGGTQRATAPAPTSAAAPWRELTSEHFEVWTNTSPARAHLLVQTMENLRQVVLGVSFFNKPVKGRSFVIAFDDLDEVHQYVPPQFIALAWSGRNVVFEPVIVLAASSLDHDRRIVTHELTHVISFNVIVNQPAWFAEGLAGYFETVRLDENKATVDVGVPLEFRLRQLHDHGLTPSTELFACERAECKDDRFYATTWALVTYLINEHTAQLATYMDRLVQTPASEQAALWPAVFPELPPETLDHELATWVHYGKNKVLKYNVVLHDWAVSERPIADADVLAARGLLRYLFAPDAGASSEITKSLSLDSTNLIANLIAAAARKSVAPELAHSLTATHPDDWRAWWLAWHGAQNAADTRDAREKMCGLLEANPVAAPIDACARDATGAFAEDPRRAVFTAAMPQITACLAKAKHGEIAATFAIDLEIADSGAVTAAHASVGSPQTNACVEAAMNSLAFPPHHGGPFHMGRARPATP